MTSTQHDIKKINNRLLNRWQPMAVLLLLFLGYLALSAPLIMANTRSSDWDQRDYLKIALWITEGGPFTDSNRNPLQPLLLAPLAKDDITFFTSAKLVSLLLGIVGLGVVYGVSRRIVGQNGALLVAGMLAGTAVYIETSTSVNVEVFLVSLFGLAWYAGAKAVIAPERWRWFALAGLLAGLCYLAKGTGLLFVPMLLGALFLRPFTQPSKQPWWHWLRLPGVWLFLATFSLVALPLWQYNLHTHGSPLYNINTTHYIWLDSWEESYTYPGDALPTLASYLQTHTLAQIGQRLWNGLALIPRQWYGAVRPFFLPDGWGWGTAVTGLGLGLLVHLGWTIRKRKQTFWPAYLYTLLGILANVLLFSWYHPISDDPRFVLPWTTIMFIGVVWWAKAVLSPGKHNLFNWLIWLLAGGFLLLLVTNWQDIAALKNLYATDREANQESVAIIDLVKQRTPPEGMFILGPSHAQAEWLAYDRQVQAIPHVRQNWASFQTLLLTENVTTIVLDEESWQRRQPLLGDTWTLTPNGLTAESLPPGWALVNPDSFPCRTCIFSFDKQPFLPQHPLSLTYADTFALTGTSFEPELPAANEPFTMYTHWLLLAQFQETTHVFVHILDEFGQIVAQADGQFLVDFQFYPDEVFLPGIIVRLAHHLPALPPGRYRVHAGLYRWESQERLPSRTGETYPLLFEWQLR